MIGPKALSLLLHLGVSASGRSPAPPPGLARRRSPREGRATGGPGWKCGTDAGGEEGGGQESESRGVKWVQRGGRSNGREFRATRWNAPQAPPLAHACTHPPHRMRPAQSAAVRQLSFLGLLTSMPTGRSCLLTGTVSSRPGHGGRHPLPLAQRCARAQTDTQMSMAGRRRAETPSPMERTRRRGRVKGRAHTGVRGPAASGSPFVRAGLARGRTVAASAGGQPSAAGD